MVTITLSSEVIAKVVTLVMTMIDVDVVDDNN